MTKGRGRRGSARATVALAVALVLATAGCSWIARVSVSGTGSEAHGASSEASVSADGRFVAFASDAADLVTLDNNAHRDVFVRDTTTGTVTRVSVSTAGVEANADSSHPSISADGRYVAFASDATNLTVDDTNSGTDVFLRDLVQHTTTLVSATRAPTTPAPGAGSAGVEPAAPTKQVPVRSEQPVPSGPAADGTVRVIVRAPGSVAPAAGLGLAARTRQAATEAAARARVEQTVQKAGGEVVRSFAGLGIVAAKVPESAVAALRTAPTVASVVPDRLLRPTDVGSNALIGADHANAAGVDGRGESVAILDTGVDGAHPFLTGKVVAEGCFTSSATCPNGQSTQTGPGSGAPCTFSGDCIHGTHVAGIAAGHRAAGGTYDGVAPGASIIAVQVFSFVSDCACPLAFDSDIIAGLEYVRSLRDTFHIASVNMSLGSGPHDGPCDDDAEKPAIDNLRAAGIATVIASGNESSTTGISSPGCISTAVSVGAVDDADAVAYFSNSAPQLSLLAPGVDVESSVPGGGFLKLSGTSMATPHVAGVWALVKQRSPNASVSDVLRWLRATGRPLRDPRNGLVVPRVCASVAVGAGACPDPVLPKPPPNDSFADATPLPGDLGSLTGTNIGAGVEPGEPRPLGAPVGASVWFTFTPSAAGTLDVDTAGSAFDTVLGVYQGTTLASLTPVAENDDAPGGLTSAVGPVRVRGGVTYHVLLAGFVADSGQFTLRWRFRVSLGDSTSPAISGDGRFVAFASTVATLVAGDTNRAEDVFVRDVGGRTTERVSVSARGVQGNDASSEAAISGDGGKVAFASKATNLVTNDANGHSDVFLRRRTDAASVRRISRAADGPEANGFSGHPSLDRTGLVVAFDSVATNLVPNDTNNVSDVFIEVVATRAVQRVSVGASGAQGDHASLVPSLSGDARFVGFTASADNLVAHDANTVADVFLRDTELGTTARVSLSGSDAEADGPSSGVVVTRDGSYVAFTSAATHLVPNDTNLTTDVFLRSRKPRQSASTNVSAAAKVR